jgi:hypothetical protein
MKAQKMSFEQRYGDDSGVEFGVAYDARSMTITLTSTGSERISFPVSEIDWFVEALREVSYELPKDEKS